MANVVRVLAFLFPAAKPRIDYIVGDSGSGQAIEFWNPALGTQPTVTDISNAEASAAYATYWSAPEIAKRAQLSDAKIVNKILGVRKSTDESTSSSSFVDCAELNFQVAPNMNYKFRFTGAYTTALATTGLQISVNGPASPSFIRFVGWMFTTVTTVFSGVGAAYDAAIANTASAGATALPFTIEGTISTGATGGTFTLRFRSEVAGSNVTILRGSIGELMAVS